MIQWISEWLKEVILVILLAVFIDLLLPSNAMQRYVKVVLSLFILMAILSPIVSLFKANLNFEGWDDEVVDTSAYQSLDLILESGEQIRQNNVHHSLELIEAQLAERMKQQLELALPGQINDVIVAGSIEDNRLEINKVQVFMRSAPGRLGEMSSEKKRDSEEDAISIEPIESVVINIEIDHINEEHVLSSNGEQTDSNKQEQNALVSRILEQNWHVSSKQLVITYVEEVSSLHNEEVSLWGNCCKSWSNG